MTTQTLAGLCERRGGQTEKCLFVKSEIDLPLSLIEDVNVFLDVASLDTWQKELTDAQRRHLTQFLPTYPKNDNAEKQNTIQKVFAGENCKFGTPLRQFHAKLKEGIFSPDIARYAALCRKAKMREYRYQQQVYYSNLVKDILINRQRVLEQVYKTPVNEPLKLELPEYIPSQDKEHLLSRKVHKRYNRIIREVNEECGGESSEEEESECFPPTHPDMLPPDPDSPQDCLPPSTVMATYAPKPPAVNGQAPGTPGANVKPRPRSPTEFVEEDFREMMRKHRKRRLENESLPELDTSSLTLVDIISRAMPSKKSLIKSPGTHGPQPGLLRKKLKEKSEKRRKKTKVKEEGEVGVVGGGGVVGMVGQEEGVGVGVVNVITPAVDIGLPQDENALDGMATPAEEMQVTTVAATTTTPVTVPTSQTVPIAPPSVQANFFSLLRDFISEDQDGKTTTMKLEERVREWQESPSAATCLWFTEQASWVELVASALKFLSGDVLGLSLDNFIPLLDYKERAQQWKWIGASRDSDEQLYLLYRHWLDNKDEGGGETVDSKLQSPPAPKTRTSFVVRPTNDEEKSTFQKQERQRFSQPHKAFSYQLHGYTSVVGPVKGVYAKESTMNKARDHVLLVKDRPPYVTILTLVRDAAARLPNGEGTRGDICELLKDSQFLAPAVTDAQINNVVSGALDRLHYEKDPCVKYDVNRKLWIYLHRNRTEDEFERIHQAQGAAAKAKKALQKPKPAKKIKESVQAMAATSAPVVAPVPDSPLRVDMPSPGATSPSPRGQLVSPRTPQLSPRAPQASPKNTPKATPAPSTTTPTPSPKVTSVGQVTSVAPKLVATSSTGMVSSSKAATVAAAVVASAPKVTTHHKVLPLAQTASTVVGGAQQLTSGQIATPLALAQQQLTAAKAAAAAAAGGGAGGMAMVGGGTGTTKPLSVTFLQPSLTSGKAGALSTQSPATPPTLAPGSKPLAFSLIPSGKGTDPATANQTRTVVLTSKGETIGQKLLLTQQQHQQLQQQQQFQQHVQQQLQQQRLAAAAANPGQGGRGATAMASPKLPKTTSPSPTATAVTMVNTNTKASPKILQQMAGAGPQMVSVAGLAALQKQIATSGNATIKIQGGSILQSSGAKPMTIQRMASLEGSDMKAGQVILQRPASVEAAAEVTPATTTTTTGIMQQQVGPASPQLAISRPGGGKPATLVFTKPAVSISGKPASSLTTLTTVSSNLAAQLIQTSSLGGKPVTLGGKPIIIGGKPVQISGKPIQIGGKPVHLIGKPGGGQIGVIQGQGGMVSALNIVTQAGSAGTGVPISTLTTASQARLISTPTATAPTLVGQILHSGGAVVQAGRSGGTTVSTTKNTVVSHVGQHKVVSPASPGMMVTQLNAGAQNKPGTPPTTQTKLLAGQAQGNMLSHQILMTQGNSQGKVVNTQQLLAGAGVRPTLLTRSPGGKPTPNIQVVKTMLSQAQGSKPGQTTIVLAQAGGQQVTVTGVEQLTQAGVKTVQAAGKSKTGPIYARIISPPPGIRLTAVRSAAQVTNMPGVSVLQAVSGRLQGDPTTAHLVAQGQVAQAQVAQGQVAQGQVNQGQGGKSTDAGSDVTK